MKLTRTAGFRLPTGILDIAVDNAGRRAIAGCMDGVYEVDLLKESYRLLAVHSSYVSSVVMLEQEHVAISAGYDGRIQWHDLKLGNRIREVQTHSFWSWDMNVSSNHHWLASVTGQYLAGGYRYEPAAESEPSVRILSVETGEIVRSLPHVPSVQAVAFTQDSRYVAAGNLMGEVRIWRIADGELVASWTTDAFTSWGIIKSHCYLGGIFALQFSPDDRYVYLAGMGPMKDPMAGNGKQLWQKWSWQSESPELADETHQGDNGEGLMEALAFHPDGGSFVMAGRLRGGKWNAALFGTTTGSQLSTLKTGYRITSADFASGGELLVLAGAQGQPGKSNAPSAEGFGQVELYSVES